MALCEAAAYYKTQGKTLWDAMIEMYEQFGYYKDAIQSVTMKGIEGLQKIQEIMNSLRQNPPAEFAGLQSDGSKRLQGRYDYRCGNRSSKTDRSSEFQRSVL